ncbi:hypothetical protein SCUCBS95973_007233 [Sporothrix curviconia]|uniref:ABC transporter n=1 Tax=Sporothrix curviconia TaxID=1260050 RepID=A0ABP0CE07_9PEZI
MASVQQPACIFYLIATLVADFLLLAAPTPLGGSALFGRAVCLQAATKLVLLVLESRSKAHILRDEFAGRPPEDLAGILSLAYFWWLHDLLSLGYRKILSTDDLPRPALISWAISFVEKPAEEQIGDADASATGFWIVVTATIIYFGLTGAAEMLHEMWAFCVEAVVGFSMLAREIGWLWPLPAGIVFVFSQTSRYAVKPMKTRQTVWNEATQKRLSMTSSVLGAIKSVKMLGIQTAAEDLILHLRERELNAAKDVRWLNVLYNSSANALGLFSPVLTVALFAVFSSANGREFDTRTAFTATAILSMITHPINMIMTILPRIAASMSSFERIQAYLLRPKIEDKRLALQADDSQHPAAAIVLRDVTISGEQAPQPILQSVNLSIEKGSLVVITGPVGSGKSLLLQTILGEAAFQNGSIHVSSKSPYFHLGDNILLLAEGTVKCQGPWSRLQSQNPGVFQWLSTEPNPGASGSESVENVTAQTRTGPPSKNSNKALPVTDYHKKDGDLSLYRYYITSAGIWNVLLVASLTMTYAFFFTMSVSYLKWWTESKTRHTVMYALGYVSMLVVAWIATSFLKWADIILVAGRSGEILHRRLLQSTCNAHLVFFSATDLGTVLNRFTQDIQLVDKQISVAMSGLLAQIFKLLMQVIVLLMSQPLLALTLPVCVASVYAVQKRYLRTSRQLRRMELESQSAVYFSFLETASGLQTIRVFGWQAAMSRKNAACLDDAQRPVYLMLCLRRWLNVVLDTLVASIAVGTVWLAVAGAVSSQPTSQPNTVWRPSGGQVGVALNIILVTNTTLLSLVQMWTNLEVSLGAVARLREAAQETPQEEPRDETVGEAQDAVQSDEEGVGAVSRLLPDWPNAGEVELKNVTASYKPETRVLNGVDLRIKPGQVAVICGRTGSGKSSLLMSLLRLLTVRPTGTISVDGVDLAGLRVDDIRRRAFVTVSQDPFLVPSASLRFHLDPAETLPDTALAEALRRTRLLRLFAGSSYDDSLEAALTTPSSSSSSSSLWDRALSSFPVLSAGQAQLLSLARALLQLQTRSSGKRKPIVLLDEITASLDAETEAAVYDVVEEVFIKGRAGAGHTVLVVTHRPAALARRLRPGQDATIWMGHGQVERVETLPENQGAFERSGDSYLE